MPKADRVNRSMKKLFINNFVGGIAWGLGVTVGLTLVLAIVGFFIGQLDYVPIIGTFVSDIVNFIDQNRLNVTDPRTHLLTP